MLSHLLMAAIAYGCGRWSTRGGDWTEETSKTEAPLPPVDVHKMVALYEGGKAIIMVMVGLGCLSLVHRDVHEIAVRWLEQMRFNPASHSPQLFLRATIWLTDGWLRALGAAMLADAVLRFAEAYGLWNQRRWAEWLAVISGSLYFPFELYELARGFTGLKFGVLLLNIVIVVYMGWALYRRSHARPKEIQNSESFHHRGD